MSQSLTPWVMLGLLGFAVAATALTDWLAGRFRRGVGRDNLTLRALLAELIWVLIVAAAGALALRYIERLSTPLIGYALFAVIALFVSWLRAHLYRRVQEQGRLRSGRDWQQGQRLVLHTALYLLSASVCYLLLCLLTGQSARWILLVPLYVGALLPDLDSPDSGLGRLVPSIGRRLASRLGRRGAWHTPAIAALLALVTAPLIPLIGIEAWYLLPLGFLAHLGLDLLRPEGLMLLWPWHRSRYRVWGRLAGPAGGRVEGGVALVLGAATLVLLFLVDIGPQPVPPVATPSFEQNLERYYALRGRNLVIAEVQGTWQATGRRINDRYEVLNALGDTFVMLDRYTGTVFTAGRGPTDNLYLNAISLQVGAPIQIKAVEVHLEDQAMVEALPVLYQMEREPGLEHIFISGDVVLPSAGETTSPELQPDLAQTRLRKVQRQGENHYTLHYLTAAELIDLANLQIKTAELVIVATYTDAPSGPTPTPLPSPPPSQGDE